MQNVPEALAQRHQHWIDVVNEGDINAYTSLLAENAVWIPPGQDPLVGRKAFREWLVPFFDKFSYRFSISGERMKAAGDWALERAGFASEMTSYSGGDTMKHTGTFTAIWNRHNDKIWYIERYIDDSDL